MELKAEYILMNIYIYDGLCYTNQIEFIGAAAILPRVKISLILEK